MEQVIFTADKTLKRAALEKAKMEGITLKSLLNFCLKDYIGGRLRVGIRYGAESEVERIAVSRRVQRKMDRIADLLA